MLSADLAELLRHRELMWHLIPPLSRKLTLPFLTLKETLRVDSAVTERGDEKNPGDRDHLVKAYKGLQSAVFDAPCGTSAKSCSSCDAGKYSPKGSTSSIDCPAGMYSGV